MMQGLQGWYRGLAERERRFVLFGGIGALLVLVVGLVLPLNRNIAQARQRVATKQIDLAIIQAALPQLRSGGPAVNPATADNIVVLTDTSAREGGLGKALTSSQPTGDGGVRLRLDHAPFDAIVAWLARLSQQHGVRVESAEVESAGEPGLVNAGFVLKPG